MKRIWVGLIVVVGMLTMPSRSMLYAEYPGLTINARDRGDSFIHRYEYSGGLVIYAGSAMPGTASSAAGWQIKKFTYTGSDVTLIQFANGTENFDAIWDNRASYSYS